MKNEEIKVNGNKFVLNYSPAEINEIAERYNEAMNLGEIRTVKSYFAEACLKDPELKKEQNSFSDLINIFTNKANQFSRMGATYVFGTEVKSVILHKGADSVVRTNPKVERDLLGYILRENVGNDNLYLQFLPGFIINIKGARTIEVIFDFRENIRNY